MTIGTDRPLFLGQSTPQSYRMEQDAHDSKLTLNIEHTLEIYLAVGRTRKDSDDEV